jgi:hypothetical protein
VASKTSHIVQMKCFSLVLTSSKEKQTNKRTSKNKIKQTKNKQNKTRTPKITYAPE